MRDKDKTKKQLIEELIELRRRIAELANQKQAEETLQESEKQYRNLADNSLVGIYKTSLEGKILYANEALCRIFGYESTKKMMSEGVLNKYKNRSDRKILIKKLKEKGRVRNFEVELVKKNGDTIIVLLSAVLDGDVISGMMMDITRRKKMEERLKEAAITDDLTGLFNRRGFFTISEKQCKLANRTGRGMALLYMDLDGMKTINDELGHKAGDQALVDTANILKKSFRESDIIARIGGDEFAVLLTELSEPDIEYLIADHLQDNLRIHNKQEGLAYELWLSMGIAHFDPQQPYSIDVLISRADSLMYKDKKHHRLRERKQPY
ncbi:MAG TPA: sensor domain-containing diguanylate cyclase [Nitrospirae bacterium]|nr:sensor domain-containing diguanylate cyclase [Nitrospirota bacterium]